MKLYVDVLMGLEFVVDLSLLIGAERLAGYRSKGCRYPIAAAVGAVYSGLCVMPGLGLISGTVGRVLVLGVMGLIAYGGSGYAFRRSILFLFLSMALGGVAYLFQSRGFWALVFSALGVCGLCVLGFRGRAGDRYLAVRIRERDREHRFTALLDTGNGLRDPVTGRPVLVVSGSIGRKLTGLSRQELADPAGSALRYPGIRLVSFSAVGTEGGLMAAKRFEDVTVGKWRGSLLVAFAPNELGAGRPYEALTGGVL